MVTTSPKEAGDIIYSNQAWKIEVSAARTTGLTKGRLYTKTGGSGTSAHLLTTASATSGWEHGIFQATRDVTAAASGTTGTNDVDVLTHPSFILLTAKTAGLGSGSVVKYDFTNHNVEAWDETNDNVNLVVGRVQKVYTTDDVNSPNRGKDVSAVGDLVIVHLGGAI